MSRTERLLPDIPELTPAQEEYLEALAHAIAAEPDSGLHDEAADSSEDTRATKERLLGSVATRLFSAPKEGLPPQEPALEPDRLCERVARVCLERAMAGHGGYPLMVRYLAAAELHRLDCVQPSDVMAITETFLADDREEFFLLDPEMWERLRELVLTVIHRHDVSARKRLAIGLAVLSDELFPPAVRLPVLDGVLAVAELTEDASLELLRRMAGGEALFVPYRGHTQTLDPRGSSLMPGSAGAETRAQVLTAIDRFLAEGLTVARKTEAAKTLAGLAGCLTWLKTEAGLEFARESLLFLLPKMARAEPRADRPSLRLVGPSGPVDEDIEALFEQLSRRIEESGAHEMVVFCLVPALPAAVAGISEDLLEDILAVAADPAPSRDRARGRKTARAPRRLSAGQRQELDEAVQAWLQEAEVHVVPPVAAHLTETANLSLEETAAVEAEMRAAREAAEEGRDFELSPRTTLLFSPQASWVKSRAARFAAAGLEVAVARRLTERGMTPRDAALLAAETWNQHSIYDAGPDMVWAGWLVQSSNVEFEREVHELVGTLARLAPLAPDSPMPTVRFEVELEGFGQPVRVLEMTVDQTLWDLHEEIHRAFGWDFDPDFEFHSEDDDLEEDLGFAGIESWRRYPLLKLELGPKNPGLTYVLTPGFDEVKLVLRQVGSSVAAPGERYPRLLESRGESPAGDELFSD